MSALLKSGQNISRLAEFAVPLYPRGFGDFEAAGDAGKAPALGISLLRETYFRLQYFEEHPKFSGGQRFL